MSFSTKLKELITLLEKWLPDPVELSHVEDWMESATALAESFVFSDIEQIYVDRILKMYQEQFTAILQKKENVIQEPMEVEIDSLMEELNELTQRKQTEQRTPEWYAQQSTILSASELGSLFASPYQRGKLVLSKTIPCPPRNQSLAVFSDYMSAFDWGIRFEPVVKQIYEHRYQATVKELGRLHHQTDPRCTASPDGLVYDCVTNPEKRGRLVEIKCPVTREINGIIPKDYYTQMQMQLHVTGRKYCDYIEAVFSSKYNQLVMKEGPGSYEGIIALVRYAEMKGNQEFYYVYSPIHCEADWVPEIGEGEELMELIPWRLIQWSEQVVERSEEWWRNLQPLLEVFWEDVEKAKRGEFMVPESSRAPKRKKEEVCQIVFRKLDEEGVPIQEGSPSKKPCHPMIQSMSELNLSACSEMIVEDTSQ